MVAVCNWLNAPTWVMWGLPIVICGGAVVTWITRLAKWTPKKPGTP